MTPLLIGIKKIFYLRHNEIFSKSTVPVFPHKGRRYKKYQKHKHLIINECNVNILTNTADNKTLKFLTLASMSVLITIKNCISFVV